MTFILSDKQGISLLTASYKTQLNKICERNNKHKMATTTPLFEFTFREPRKLSAFIKTCESMCFHSDTALFKVKKRGIYVLLTDLESFCCLECRFTENIQNMLKMVCHEFSAKILLDSLTSILRKILKNKHSAILYAASQHQLLVREVGAQSSKVIETYTVESTETRARVYYLLSTHEFREQSSDYVQFRIQNVEFNKIITMQSILSGSSGGIGEITVTPLEDNKCSIRFFLKNHSGAAGGVTIHSFPTAETVPIQRMPQSQIIMNYFLTYLKRSQNLFAMPLDFITVYISKRGILIQTDVKENHSIVIFTVATDDIDLDSFC